MSSLIRRLSSRPGRPHPSLSRRGHVPERRAPDRGPTRSGPRCPVRGNSGRYVRRNRPPGRLPSRPRPPEECHNNTDGRRHPPRWDFLKRTRPAIPSEATSPFSSLPLLRCSRRPASLGARSVTIRGRRVDPRSTRWGPRRIARSRGRRTHAVPTPPRIDARRQGCFASRSTAVGSVVGRVVPRQRAAVSPGETLI